MKISKIMIPLLAAATVPSVLVPALAGCSTTNTFDKHINAKNIVDNEDVEFKLSKSAITKKEFTEGFELKIELDIASETTQYVFVLESIVIGGKILDTTNYVVVYDSEPFFFSKAITVTFNPGMKVEDYSGDITINVRASNASFIQVVNVDATSGENAGINVDSIDLSNFDGKLYLNFPSTNYGAHYMMGEIYIDYGPDQDNLESEQLISGTDYNSHTTDHPPYVEIIDSGITKLYNHYLSDIEILRIEWTITQSSDK